RGDGPAERRARHVVKANFVTEAYRARLTAVLAADAHLESLVGAPAPLGGDPHELADPGLVDRFERIARIDLEIRDVRDEKARRIVPRDAERGLRQVVRTEREELRHFGDLVG